ncbi:hypothetical protein SCOR_22930 [Sulfidibacter corallicola]|uniref:Uncharacterized protein n=1 Tax=Sulfidibacter corallicola TaxID=2818388 RepID=A0A8A4TRZ8_SULCO|nr:hypothetical protein [Sulfidibacter corallicola]QTD52736.1 hypothetical protein J3U87_09690 [Sulfidibacter corallicola]
MKKSTIVIEEIRDLFFQLWQDALAWLAANPTAGSIILLLFAAVTVFLTLKAVALKNRWSGYFGRRRGLRAERGALKLLRRAGYTVIDPDPRISYELWIDGARRRFDITPDLLVARDGKDYIVEIKRKERLGGINNAIVRRQVLEYAVATGGPCLLVDMTSRTITEVALPGHIRERIAEDAAHAFE